MQTLIRSCGHRIHWITLALGIFLIPLGGLLSATVYGVVVGGPMLLVTLALLRDSVTPQPCV